MSDVPASSIDIPSRVIVVGSSAGGLKALQSMLGAVERGSGWCLIVAQHLSPGPSASAGGLADILDRSTALDVVEASDGDLLVADSVFIAPPGHDIVVDADTVSIESPHSQRPWPNIDRLFLSSARAFAERSIAVVLSGTGNDGAAGVEAIESVGGVVVVQQSATFESMPDASFATGSVDIVADAASIPGELTRYFDNAASNSTDAAHPEQLDTIDPIQLADITTILFSRSGVEFSEYKPSTLCRQIARRQRLLALADLDTYIVHLRGAPDEADALVRALLVTVTAFFRDPFVWDGIRDRLITAVAEAKTPQLRIWVPGCATGQEAYTVAMLAADALGVPENELQGRLKIFATDLDEDALDIARRGSFLDSEADLIPVELLKRWTRTTVGGVEFLPALRECIVFARHNVAFDPPFPRLDLISLRNTLIYFQPGLQERVLQLCQFALVPNGLLLLGQSERVPRAGEMFVVVDDDLRLYRRRQHVRMLGLPLGRLDSTSTTSRRAEPFDIASRNSPAESVYYRDILKSLARSALILDDRSALVEVIGDVAPWCFVGEGAHNGTVVDLLRNEYRSAVRAMLSQLRHSTPNTATRSIRTSGGTTHITVTRIESEIRREGGAIVIFDPSPATDAEDAATPTSQIEHTDSEQVGAELESVYEALQATVEDLSTSNEELQALNEELQASSEELQASSEEVQASNEELEATNEELTTLNHELAKRTSDLTRANTDLENIQTSMTNGLVLLDPQFRVTRFTALAVRLFSLIATDVGRLLTAVPTTIEVPGLADALTATFVSGTSRIIELDSADRDLLVQTQPYRGEKNDVIGVIVVVIDVSEITAERRSRESALANLEIVTESIDALVWQRDTSGNLTLLTHRIEDLYGLDRARVLADPSLLLAAVHPDDRARVAATSASSQPNWRIKYRIVRPDGRVRWIDESASLMHPRDGSPPVRVGTATDVTEQQQAAAEQQSRSTVLSMLFDSSLGIFLVDRDDRVVQASTAAEQMTGFDRASLIGRPFSSLVAHGSDGVDTAGPDSRIVRADGRTVPVTLEYPGSPAGGDEPTIVIAHDRSYLRRMSSELAAHEQFDQQTGLLTRRFFRASATEAVAKTQPSAILWIDLDGFKEVNDRLGHRSGDHVLDVVATRLKHAVNKHHLVGRLGGDEFAVLVNRADDLDELDNLAHRILSSIREPIVIDETHALISASIGIAVTPQDGSTADELLHNSDVAMYSAKQNGRDQHVYFTSQMDRDADARAGLRHRLAAAVRHRDFELFYQPIVYVETGEIAMLEALVRWRRGDEVVTAGEFIDLAAETGQLRALGHLIVDCLVSDVEDLYRALGPDHPRVAVNLSATELRERDLMDRLTSWHPSAGFDKIVVEVTEQVTLDPGDRAFDTLALLRRLGATISIDDFGTGYSNLELLGKLKPGIIKIDRSLTESAAVDRRGVRILEAAVQLAHAMEAATVIEGVGSAELSAVAAATDAEMMQGFHLGIPVPLSDIIDSIGRADQVG